jgi:hypothetical protein
MTLPSLESTSPEIREHKLRRAAKVKLRDAKKAEYLEIKARKVGQEQNHDAYINSLMTDDAASNITANPDDAYAIWSDLYEVVVALDKKGQAIVEKATKDYNAKHVRPIEDSLLKRMATALCEFHSAYEEQYQLRNELHGKLGLKPVGLANIRFYEMFGVPTDKQGPLGELLAELVAAGALSKMPATLR